MLKLWGVKMDYVICLAIAVLPTATIVYGAIQGFFDDIIPDNMGVLELTERGTYELRIL